MKKRCEFASTIAKSCAGSQGHRPARRLATGRRIPSSLPRPSAGRSAPAPRSSSSNTSPRRVITRRSWCELTLTGMTSRPPSASCCFSDSGGAGAPAATRIASKGARSGTPREPSPSMHRDVGIAEPFERLARAVGERRVALDRRPPRRELRQHRGGVARAGADLEHARVRLIRAASAISATI